MSKTRQSGSPRGGGPTDFFETPAWCVDRLLELWRGIPPGGRVVEPSAGRGAIIRAVEAALPDHGIRWHAIECIATQEWTLKQSGERVVVEIGDFLRPSRAINAHPVPVIGNPPYSQAEAFIRWARRCYPESEIVFLLRVNFLGADDRVPLWREVGEPDIFVLPNRPSFGLNKHGKPGTDGSEYAWFRWPAIPRTAGYVKHLAVTPLAVRNPRKPRQ